MSVNKARNNEMWSMITNSYILGASAIILAKESDLEIIPFIISRAPSSIKLYDPTSSIESGLLLKDKVRPRIITLFIGHYIFNI